VVRPSDESAGGRIEALDSFISREHYLMWRPSATGPYVRAGRFFPVYGLRLVEHPFYVRRYTGFNLYEEPYAVAGGYVEDDWEVHLAAFTPVPTSFPDQFQSVGYRENGGALYAEKRFNGMAALALQTRIGAGKEEARYQGGAVGKLWLEQVKMLVQGEFDFIHQTISGAGFSQNGVVAYVGPTFFPTRGLFATLAYERYQPDLSVRGSAQNAYDLEFNIFPIAHFEIVLLGRIQTAGDGLTNTLGMFQLHYYL